MAAPGSLYDIYLGAPDNIQGYMLRSTVRDSAPLVAARFSTGEQGQTDLDLLKSKSVDGVAGGMFQRTHDDPQKVARAVGWYNPFEENLYPTVPVTASSGTAGAGSVICKVESESYAFANYYQNSGGAAYNQITKYVGNAATNLTVPAALYAAASGTQVNDLCLHKNYLFLASTQAGHPATNNYRYNITANTWQDITGNAAFFFTLRGVLYMVNNTCTIYSVTNEFAAGAATYTQVSAVGGLDTIPERAIEFNGAAWITKPDGIYRFDGLSCVRVLPLYAKKLTNWNGKMYFMVGKWLYSFDGTNVTKLQYFVDDILQISASSSYLFFQSWVTTSYTDSPKLPSGVGFCRIYSYDGAAFGIVLEKDMSIGSAIDHLTTYSSNYLVYSQPQFSGAAWGSCNMYPVNLANIFSSAAVDSTSQLDITTSEDDDDFPNIYKSFESIDVSYADMVAGDIITVKYQLYDGKTWGSWITAGTISSTSDNRIEITATNRIYKRVKINAYVSTMTAASTIRLKGCSWRYTLQPRMRWRWQVTLMAEGNKTIRDRGENEITADANSFTNHVLKSAKSKTPIYFFTPDYGKVKTQINAAATSFIILGQIPLYTDPYNEYPLVAVKNSNGVWEILQVTASSYSSVNDETTVTVLARGYLGITAAQINANAEFHLAHKVYLTRLLRDAPILNSETYNEQPTTGESQLQREYTVELIEA